MALNDFGRGLEGIVGRVVYMKHRLRLYRRAAGDSLRWIAYVQILPTSYLCMFICENGNLE